MLCIPLSAKIVDENKRKAEEKWGSGIVEQVSLDLQAAFPESKGFSTTNLWRMKQWYMFYAQESKKLPQLVGELQGTDFQGGKKLPQLVGVGYGRIV